MAERYHRNIYASYAYMALFGLFFSIALGPLFDVYLFKLGGKGKGNTLVGAVESVSGIVSLALVIPVGYVVDSFDRLLLMRIGAVTGLLTSAVGSYAVLKDSIPGWYATMVLSGLYTSLGNSVCLAIFADSVKSEQRMKATTTMAIVNNVALSAGPFLTLIAFLFIGDNWEMYQLRAILLVGMIVVGPITCLSMLMFEKAPYSGDSVGEAEEVDEDEDTSGKYSKLAGAKWVPCLVAFSDLVTMVGAGMTIKYFNLYWKNDWDMSPAQVLAISVVQPLSIAFFIRILERPAQWMGRAQAAVGAFAGSIFAMVVLAEVNTCSVALAAYFVRSGLANASYPYNKSIMFDFTPSSQRGRWNAVETLCGSVWSGSAFIGGYMADHYDYRFTFLVTAGVYAVAALIYSPLLAIVPRQSMDGKPDAKPLPAYATPTLTPSGKRNQQLQAFASPKLFCSPGHAMRVRTGSEI